VYVREGDKVKKGDPLAQLETDVLDLALTQAKLRCHRREYADASQGCGSAGGSGLRTAAYDLNQALEHYTWRIPKPLRPMWMMPKLILIMCRYTAPGALEYARVKLISAESQADALIKVYDSEEVVIKKLQVATANISRAGKQSLEPAQQSVNRGAGGALAQKQFDEAVITAPFDGIVASVGARVGDTVAPTVIMVHLVDTSTLDLIAEIDEMDVPKN